MRLFLFTISLTLSLTALSQQGQNFSMWFHNDYQHNPAAVGNNDLDLKFFVNTRLQYFTVADKPLLTISAAGEAKIFRSKKSKNHFGVGASIINDMSGNGRYTVNDIAVPISYHIYFDEHNSMSLGIAPGIYNRSIGVGNYNWESQWSGYYFDNDNLGDANFINTSGKTNFDLGSGLMFKHQKSVTNKFYIGVSARHLLQPKIEFSQIEERLNMRFIGQFGMKHRFHLSNFGISPNVLAVFQGPNHNIVVGSNFDFYLQDPSLRTIFLTPTYFSVGAYYRYLEGLILNFQFSIKGFNIALAYDTNLNSMTPSSKSVGGFELALSYDIMLNKRDRLLY